MVNIIDLKREIIHILGDKSTDYFKLLTLYFSGRIEKGIDSKSVYTVKSLQWILSMELYIR